VMAVTKSIVAFLFLVFSAPSTFGQVTGYSTSCGCSSCKVVTKGKYAGIYELVDGQEKMCQKGCLYRKKTTGTFFCMCEPGDVPFVTEDKCSDCISSPADYATQLQAIFDGEERQFSVCKNALFTRTDTFWKGQSLPGSLSKHSLMWVFVSDWTVLNTFLDFASEECSFTGAKAGRCNRTLLIERMMNYVGFDSNDIFANINNADFNNFTMVIVDQQKTTDAWNFDLGPFQPKWDELYSYLSSPEGFQVCDNNGCHKRHMPAEFYATLTGGPSQPNGIKDYSALTAHCLGFTAGPWPTGPRADCSVYETMKAAFFDSFCPDHSPCGSTACVDIYIAGPDNVWPSDNLDKLTLWTRAFFEQCMGMNPWFTGLGLAYDPTNKRTTGNEWLVRGDKAVSSASLDAAYVVLWNKDMKA